MIIFHLARRVTKDYCWNFEVGVLQPSTEIKNKGSHFGGQAAIASFRTHSCNLYSRVVSVGNAVYPCSFLDVSWRRMIPGSSIEIKIKVYTLICLSVKITLHRIGQRTLTCLRHRSQPHRTPVYKYYLRPHTIIFNISVVFPKFSKT